MSLNAQMRAFQRAFTLDADPDIVDALRRAQTALQSTDILGRAVKAGVSIPEFTLPDTRGQAVSMCRLLLRGPVVVSFYRGDWCDYCVMELAALAAAHHEISRLGASLIAISPQAPDARLRRSQVEPPFPLLFDAGAKVARRCGIAFTLSDEVRPIYAGAGRKPPSEGPDNWQLPLPATYIVDWTGEIVFSFLSTDYTTRLEPADILTVLAPLARRMERERPRWGARGKDSGATKGRGTVQRELINPSPTRTS
jgi:peroxiredoxin